MRILPLIILSIFFINCEVKSKEENFSSKVDMSILAKEIKSRLREYETHLQNGDSIALGDMYMENAEIIPSNKGRKEIIKVFGSSIRHGIKGSTFTTTHLWGNEELLVEDGTGTWYYKDSIVAASGRYLLVWKKDDGKWKILRDTWFPDKKK
ncbi:YybH family protein [Eudoraea chungangensis]|uniref:YybH family protein n=1 Tax=Eudoraea chungangensis TaxID=1481905 RepID=UPI0023EAC79C|nr:DUF4440 domain-containing protein [Eudoraea chungangensis]